MTPERPKSHLEEGAPWEPEAQGLAEYLGLSLIGSLAGARVVLALDWPVTLTPHPSTLVLTVSLYVFQRAALAKMGRRRDSLPLVILLGWGNARNRNLTKYSAIYRKRVSTAGMGTPRVLEPCHMELLCRELSLGCPLLWAAAKADHQCRGPENGIQNGL